MNDGSTVEVYVATHKKMNMKIPEYCRRVQVNCANSNAKWDGYVHDDEGINISEKNPFYCELTVLYWGWKNSKADVKGLCHYRRFFSSEQRADLIPFVYTDEKSLYKNCLAQGEICDILSEGYDVIMPMQYIPYPITVEQDLEEYCYKKDIEALTSVFREEYPEYLGTLQTVLASKNMSYCNMLIAGREVYDEYCQWLFDVLEKVEKRCDLTGYDTQHRRIYGYMSEVLLNVYVQKNGLRCKYLKIALIKPTDKLKDRVIYFVLSVRSGFHKILCKIHCYGVMEAVYRVFAKSKYERYMECKRRNGQA